jgi:hypothetical protein
MNSTTYDVIGNAFKVSPETVERAAQFIETAACYFYMVSIFKTLRESSTVLSWMSWN